jgi:hypothetical protein
MTPDLALFYFFGALALVAGGCVVFQRHTVVSAFALIVTLGSLAIVYGLLGSPFIAALQVIVYAGAIMVLFLFVIMLLNVKSEDHPTGDRRALRAAAVEIGYMGADETEERARGVVELIWLVCEPLRHQGMYDFGRSTLPSRARDLGFDLAFRRGFLHAPPPETVFLHRKLVGSFLLCARIRATVDVNALVRPLLGLA